MTRDDDPERLRALMRASAQARRDEELEDFAESLYRPRYGDTHLTRRHRKSHVPRTVEEHGLSLHAKRVEELMFETIVGWMAAADAQRVRQLLQEEAVTCIGVDSARTGKTSMLLL